MCVGERPGFRWVCGIIPSMAPEGSWKVEEASGGRWGRVSQESTASDHPPSPWASAFLSSSIHSASQQWYLLSAPWAGAFCFSLGPSTTV